MVFNSIKKMIQKIDRKLISFTIEVPGKKHSEIVIILLLLLLAGCTALLYFTRRDLEVNLFFLPVIISCIVFRIRGLWVFPLAILGYHLSLIEFIRENSHMTMNSLYLRDFIEIIKWSILSLITIVTVNRYGEIKKFEERMKQDVDLARALQKTLLSKPFDLERIKILGFIHQCMKVGGDFYFFRPFKKKYVVLSIGDIMGKGIPASLVMAVVMSFFYEWGKKSYSPAFIMDRINKRLIDLWGEGAWYGTMFYSIYDEETRELTFSNAGHQKGILVKPAGEIVLLESEGFPVGIFSQYQWEEKKISLEPGDRVVLFTDGVSEARNAEGELYSLNRLLDKIKETYRLPLEEMLDIMLKDVENHAGAMIESDDVALVVMEIKQ